MTIARHIRIDVWNHPREHLPRDVIELFSENELAAYAEGVPYFQRLAATCGCRELAELLQSAELDQPMFVDIKKHDDSPWYVWFGFTFPSMKYHPRLRLAPQVSLPSNAPDRLVKLYGSFGGICESSFVGGFLPPEMILLGANHFVMDHNEVRLPEGSYAWFDFGNGDCAGWLPSGDGFMYDHETGEVTETEFSELCEVLFSQFSQSPFDDFE